MFEAFVPTSMVAGPENEDQSLLEALITGSVSVLTNEPFLYISTSLVSKSIVTA
jgi:hypothetical protein